RIQPLLSDAERDLHADAETGVDFFVNALLAAAFSGTVMIVNGAYARALDWAWLYRVLPILLAPLFYRAAVDAATRWGEVVRASFDMHHREVFGTIGFRAPDPGSDERELARKAGQFLHYGLNGRPPPLDILPPPRTAKANEDPADE